MYTGTICMKCGYVIDIWNNCVPQLLLRKSMVMAWSLCIGWHRFNGKYSTPQLSEPAVQGCAWPGTDQAEIVTLPSSFWPHLPGHDVSEKDFSLMNSKTSSEIRNAISHSFSFYPRTLPISITTAINKCFCTLLLSWLVSAALYFLLLLVFSLISFFPLISSMLLSFGGSGS